MENIYYERNLPHWHPPEATFFLTYRLAGSIPISVMKQISQYVEAEFKRTSSLYQDDVLEFKFYALQRKQFGLYDSALDKNYNEPYWLGRKEIASLVTQSLFYCAQKWFDLYAFCIMPNHVHVLMRPNLTSIPLYKILQYHKGFTGREANRILGINGPFWQRETYDHFVRTGMEFDRILRYIVQNPVKANFVNSWEKWPYTYIHPDYLDIVTNRD